MKNFLKIILTVVLICSFSLIVSASTSNGKIDQDNKYAWSENVGWILMTNDIHVTDTELTGHAWGENIGWINLNCSNDNRCNEVNFKVENDGEGNLSGYAWGENIGWINFSPDFGGVTINEEGEFEGYAWGENIGWINFNCSNDDSCDFIDFKVSTDWRPLSTRQVEPDIDSTPVRERPRTVVISTPTLSSEFDIENEEAAFLQNSHQSASGSCRRTPENISFVDIEDHYAKKAIGYVYSNCIVHGKTDRAFAPTHFITRAEVLKMVLLSNEYSEEVYDGYFSDVQFGDWFAGFVTSGLNHKIIEGYQDRTFKPNQFITRAEALKVILKAKGSKFLNEHKPKIDSKGFVDISSADWSYSYMMFAFYNDLIDIQPGRALKPNEFITRGEIAQIIYLVDKLEYFSKSTD